jgi:hypothetical protein
MSDFKKIPKEEWLKLSKEEQDYYTFEFQKSVEKRKRNTLIVTRGAAILCILALFFIGFSQYMSLEQYGKIKNQYGSMAYCYMCGLENLKKCDCQYLPRLASGGLNRTAYGLEMASWNSKSCQDYSPMEEAREWERNLSLSNISFSS